MVSKSKRDHEVVTVLFKEHRFSQLMRRDAGRPGGLQASAGRFVCDHFIRQMSPIEKLPDCDGGSHGRLLCKLEPNNEFNRVRPMKRGSDSCVIARWHDATAVAFLLHGSPQLL